jgi:putative (di)nucleoside polyphosphate hydrolase
MNEAERKSPKPRRAGIDAQGFRANVGIVLMNNDGHVFWGKRANQNAWQFPQGGIKPMETPQQAMLRELNEEVGLSAHQVEILGRTRDWLTYRLPKSLIRYHSKPLCIGQKQIWFLLRLTESDAAINLNSANRPEFDCWKWVEFDYPVQQVIEFKREVYQKALTELKPMAYKSGDDQGV